MGEKVSEKLCWTSAFTGAAGAALGRGGGGAGWANDKVGVSKRRPRTDVKMCFNLNPLGKSSNRNSLERNKNTTKLERRILPAVFVDIPVLKGVEVVGQFSDDLA